MSHELQPKTEAGRALLSDLMSSAKMLGPWQVRGAILEIEREATKDAISRAVANGWIVARGFGTYADDLGEDIP
jgi:hypothetical protein